MSTFAGQVVSIVESSHFGSAYNIILLFRTQFTIFVCWVIWSSSVYYFPIYFVVHVIVFKGSYVVAEFYRALSVTADINIEFYTHTHTHTPSHTHTVEFDLLDCTQDTVNCTNPTTIPAVAGARHNVQEVNGE